MHLKTQVILWLLSSYRGHDCILNVNESYYILIQFSERDRASFDNTEIALAAEMTRFSALVGHLWAFMIRIRKSFIAADERNRITVKVRTAAGAFDRSVQKAEIAQTRNRFLNGVTDEWQMKGKGNKATTSCQNNLLSENVL